MIKKLNLLVAYEYLTNVYSNCTSSCSTSRALSIDAVT